MASSGTAYLIHHVAVPQWPPNLLQPLVVLGHGRLLGRLGRQLCTTRQQPAGSRCTWGIACMHIVSVWIQLRHANPKVLGTLTWQHVCQRTDRIFHQSLQQRRLTPCSANKVADPTPATGFRNLTAAHLAMSFACSSNCGKGTTFQGSPTKDRLWPRAGTNMCWYLQADIYTSDQPS